MRSPSCVLILALVLVASTFPVPTEAAGRGKTLRTLPYSMDYRTHEVWLGAPAPVRSLRSSGGTGVFTAFGSFGNINYTSSDVGVARGMSARSAGTFALKDRDRSVFDGRRGVDGAEFIRRSQEAGAN